MWPARSTSRSVKNKIKETMKDEREREDEDCREGGEGEEAMRQVIL